MYVRFLLPMPKTVEALEDPLVIVRNPQHLIFVNKYQATNFSDPVKAYVETYGCKRESAKCSAYRLLEKDNIKAEIANRLRVTEVVNLESLSSDLAKYRTWAEEAKDYDSAAEISFKLAKLLGLVVDKREDITTPPLLNESQLTDELRRRGFVPVPTN